MEGKQKSKRSKKERMKQENKPGSVYVPGGIANFLSSGHGEMNVAAESKSNALSSFFQPSTIIPKGNVAPIINLPLKASQGTGRVTPSKIQSFETEVEGNSSEKRKTEGNDESISGGTLPKKQLSKRRADDDDEDGDVLIKKKRKMQEPMDPIVLARTVFVGNLPINISKKELKGLFKTYGTIESIRFRSMGVADPSMSKKVAAIKQDLNPKKTSFNAYIVFEEEECARAALASNGKVVNKHHLRVDIASNDKEHDMKRSLFVGNLPFNVDDEAVRTHFEEFGRIEGVRLIRDKATGVGKGFGYVLFEDSSSVQFALKSDGSKLKGRSLRVKRAVKKEKQKGQISRQRDHSNQGVKFTPRTSKSKSRGGSKFQGQTGPRKAQFKNKMKRRQKPGGTKKGKQKR